MDNFTQFYPPNNFTNNVPLIQIMAGKFHVEVNNKVANIIRPLNGNPVKYMDNENPKISKHLLVEFGDSGRYLNFYGVHPEPTSTGDMQMIINNPMAKELLTQFEVAWPSDLNDIPLTPMTFRSTPQTRPLNLASSNIEKITFVSSIHETDRLNLGTKVVNAELIASNQDASSGKWYSSYDNNSALIANALRNEYGDMFKYSTTYVFGNVMTRFVTIQLPANAFGYADNF